MRRFGTEQKIGVEINRRVRRAGAIDANWDSGVRAFLEIAVHPQRNGNILFLGEMNLAHRNRLERLIG